MPDANITFNDRARLRDIVERIGDASYWAVDNELADSYKPDVAIWDAEGDETCIVRAQSHRGKTGRETERYEDVMRRARCIAVALDVAYDIANGNEVTFRDVEGLVRQ